MFSPVDEPGQLLPSVPGAAARHQLAERGGRTLHPPLEAVRERHEVLGLLQRRERVVDERRLPGERRVRGLGLARECLGHLAELRGAHHDRLRWRRAVEASVRGDELVDERLEVAHTRQRVQPAVDAVDRDRHATPVQPELDLVAGADAGRVGREVREPHAVALRPRVPLEDAQVIDRAVAREDGAVHGPRLRDHTAREGHVDRRAEHLRDGRIDLGGAGRGLRERATPLLGERATAGPLGVDGEVGALVGEPRLVARHRGAVEVRREQLALRRGDEQGVRGRRDDHEQRPDRERDEGHGMVEEATRGLAPERMPMRNARTRPPRLNRRVLHPTSIYVEVVT